MEVMEVKYKNSKRVYEWQKGLSLKWLHSYIIIDASKTIGVSESEDGYRSGGTIEARFAKYSRSLCHLFINDETDEWYKVEESISDDELQFLYKNYSFDSESNPRRSPYYRKYTFKEALFEGWHDSDECIKKFKQAALVGGAILSAQKELGEFDGCTVEATGDEVESFEELYRSHFNVESVEVVIPGQAEPLVLSYGYELVDVTENMGYPYIRCKRIYELDEEYNKLVAQNLQSARMGSLDVVGFYDSVYTDEISDDRLAEIEEHFNSSRQDPLVIGSVNYGVVPVRLFLDDDAQFVDDIRVYMTDRPGFIGVDCIELEDISKLKLLLKDSQQFFADQKEKVNLPVVQEVQAESQEQLEQIDSEEKDDTSDNLDLSNLFGGNAHII